MPTDVVPKVKDLLWSFRHVFFNERTPQQFREGIRMRPVKFDRLPDRQPRKEKLRRMSDRKLQSLKQHITTLLDQHVIKEIDDIASTHASPVHLVIEQRFVASKNTVVEKSRLTVDLRELNKVMPSASWPLPNMDSFRSECAQKGFNIFSNFDAAAFYYQIPVDEECARLNFGMHALGRVYVLVRLAMGLKNSPAVGQCVNERAFRCHDHVRPFLDDLTSFSRSEQEHLEIDLPKMLAICSYYNILLKPQKADSQHFW